MKALWTLLTASLLILSGCKSNQPSKWADVPLSEGDVPYVLGPGTYVDIDGVEHVEKGNRWSFSEASVYEYVKWLASGKHGDK